MNPTQHHHHEHDRTKPTALPPSAVQPSPSTANGIEVAQCNLKGSIERLRRLHEEMQRRDRQWNVIAIQDPPKSLPWWDREFSHYELWYQTEDEINEDDDPRSFCFRNVRRGPRNGKKGPKSKKGRLFHIAAVAFLVKKLIAASNWAATLLEPAELCQKVATLSITTTSGDTIRIHNVYNQKKALAKLSLLGDHCVGSSDILLGDFNLHVKLWTGPDGATDEQGRELADLMHKHGMVCLNKPGQLTYSRSVIDL